MGIVNRLPAGRAFAVAAARGIEVLILTGIGAKLKSWQI
jgi:hypothetical protein